MTGAPLSLEEAQERLLALAAPLPVERIDAAGAIGRYLAEPLRARRTQPAADLSAMDGYAVAGERLAGPWTLIGESAAGHPFCGTVGEGQAVRISTGAVMPAGASAVVLQEDVTRDGGRVSLNGTAPDPPGRHIRRKGFDFAEGAELLSAGARIGPAQMALAIGAGHRQLAVRRPPRIAILDCGDELAADPTDCDVYQVPASNGPMLAAMAAAVPCTVRRIGPVADSLDALGGAFAQAQDCDLVVTSGGASVGDHDLIQPALAAWGAEIDFWRIAIKPGKPLLVARRGATVILGLPGNPVSSHVTAYLFLLPLLRTLLGATEPLPRTISARLGAPLPAGGPRREFVRGRWDGADATPHPVQDSGALASLAASNALIERPAHVAAAVAGDSVQIFPLGNGGIL